jgi:hypothetical protein
LSAAAPAPVPASDTQKSEAVALRITSFLERLRDSTSRGVVRKALLEYLQSDTRLVDVALDLIITWGWKAFDERARAAIALSDTGEKVPSRPALLSSDVNLDLWIRELAELHRRNPNLQLVLSPATSQAALRLTDHWNALFNTNFGKVGFTRDEDWMTFAGKIRYLAHLCGEPIRHDHVVLSPTVYSSLWEKMTSFLTSAPQSRKCEARSKPLFATTNRKSIVPRPRPATVVISEESGRSEEWNVEAVLERDANHHACSHPTRREDAR